MRNIFVLFLLLFITVLPAFASGFPEKIPLKSATQSFTNEYEVSILDGRLWYRRVSKTDAPPPNWELLGRKGLPADSSLHFTGAAEFDSLKSVTELSTDGDNLIAIGSDSYVYYMKWSTRRWMNKWGKPISGKLRLPEDIRSWSISHRGSFAGGYHDIDGNFHPVFAGVTTLYTLSGDGLNIYYADPWLPPDFSRQICGPLRNRFRARSLSASASTLFVISDAGEMYTRLADYDTMGNNPFLDYSYERKKRKITLQKDVRTLPPEDWKKQPSIPGIEGKISSAITIFQTGKGNDSRELRVEGVNAQGLHGFFSKPVLGETWNFTRTDLPLQKPLLSSDGANSDMGPDLDKNLSGYLRIRSPFKEQKYRAELKYFNPLCSGATLVVETGFDHAEFPLLTTTSSPTDQKMEGAIILSDQLRIKSANNKLLQEFIKNIFGESSFIKIRLKINEGGTVKVNSASLLSKFPKVDMEFGDQLNSAGSSVDKRRDLE